MSMLENGVSDQARFSVKSFIFNGDESNTDMFVHCKVRICDSVGDNCDLSTHCSSDRKRLVLSTKCKLEINSIFRRSVVEDSKREDSSGGDLFATLSDEALGEEYINLKTEFKLGAVTHESYFKQHRSKMMSRIGSMTKKFFGYFG